MNSVQVEPVQPASHVEHEPNQPLQCCPRAAKMLDAVSADELTEPATCDNRQGFSSQSLKL